MTNETFMKYFYILPFSGETRSKPFITAFFFLIYVVGVLINSSIITVICLEVQLHKPMYLFICNLSIVDIFYTSVTVPKLLHMLLSGNHIVSSAQCYTQLYFFFTVAAVEETLLFFFCDIKSLTRISCTGTGIFLIITGIDIFIFGCIPVTCTFISYFKIFYVIFNMKSRESRKKAFSTCSSHLTVIFIYYAMSITDYLIPTQSDVLDLIFNTVFATLIPMTNPIIYSLKNSNVKTAMVGLIKKMFLLTN
ncbi:hypothetical protein GDO81_023908 [Engystomops pustulosus]|uniref:G-protein coupled receptors family 1 profile domain-containing protein n=1 Tax=Engystomops pustulosus TaxID=76066 RepID=A0AAV6ZTU0_ENGPU|nr:hypothetical protein GDO81_023908 [Engystomops pustulosus]